MKKNEIFRDSKNSYPKEAGYASSRLVDFAIQHAGKRILDVGCATGEYCRILNKQGFECVGVDMNPEYVANARASGVEAYCMDAESLKFADNSFDTVILFEVLEHLNNPDCVLKEVKRVARKNILVTVPNCSDFYKLRDKGLTYEHMLEMDHELFFTREDLEELLSNIFDEDKILVREGEPMVVSGVGLPWWLQKLVSLLYRLKLIKTDIHFRLFAVITLEGSR